MRRQAYESSTSACRTVAGLPTPQFVLAFDDAWDIARHLRLRGAAEWQAWADSRARPPNVPRDPGYVYRDSGWAGYCHWLGTGPGPDAEAFTNTDRLDDVAPTRPAPHSHAQMVTCWTAPHGWANTWYGPSAESLPLATPPPAEVWADVGGGGHAQAGAAQHHTAAGLGPAPNVKSRHGAKQCACGCRPTRRNIQKLTAKTVPDINAFTTIIDTILGGRAELQG